MKALNRFLPVTTFLMLSFLAWPIAAGEGVLDRTFGSGGQLTLPQGYGALAVLPDGRLQAHVLADGQLRVLRMDPNGNPDATFGPSGIRVWPVPVGDGGVAVAAVLNDGSVVLKSGFRRISTTGKQLWDLSLVRLTPDGSVDGSFGDQGVLILPADGAVGADYLYLEKLAADAGGRLYLLVDYMTGGYYGCVDEQRLYSFSSSGTPEALFQANGQRAPFLRWTYSCWDAGGGEIWPLASNRVVVQGFAGPLLYDDGVPVPGPSNFLGGQGMKSIVGQDAESILTAVSPNAIAQSAFPARIEISRWYKDLTPDLMFGGNGDGRAQIDFATLLNGPLQVWIVRVLRGHGSNAPYYVLAAFSQNYSTPILAVARLDAAGRLDRNFGRDGVQLVPSRYPFAAWPLPGDDAGLLLENAYLSAGNVGTIRLAGRQTQSPGFIQVGEDLCSYGAVREDAGVFTLHLRRLMGSSGAVSIAVRTEADTALAGSDYQDVRATLQWADGEDGDKQILIPILRDTVSEQEEQLRLVFEGESGQALLGCGSARLRISEPTITNTPPVSQSPGTSSTSPSYETVGADSGGGGSFGWGSLATLLGALFWSRRKGHRLFASLPILLLALSPNAEVLAAAGSVDPQFGTYGTIAHAGTTIAVPDGKLLLLSMNENGVAVSRAMPDGQPDLSFGSAGTVLIPVDAYHESVYEGIWFAGLQDVRLAPDGSVYIAIWKEKSATAPVRFVAQVLRVTAAGEWDRNFGTDGVLEIDGRALTPNVLGAVRILSLAVLSDGSLAAWVSLFRSAYGDCLDSVWVLTFRASGSPGATPATPILPPIAGIRACLDEFGGSLVSLADNGLLVAAPSDGTFSYLQFGADAKLLGQPRGVTVPRPYDPVFLVVNSNRELFLAWSLVMAPGHILVSRRDAQAGPDPGFGVNGVADIDLTVAGGISAGLEEVGLLVDPSDTRYLYVKGRYGGTSASVIVARLLTDGRLDTTFGIAGVLKLPDQGVYRLATVQAGGGLIFSSGEHIFRLQSDPRADSAGAVAVSQGDGVRTRRNTVYARISRVMGSSGTLNLRYKLRPSSFGPGIDATTYEGQVNWASGESGEKTVEIALSEKVGTDKKVFVMSLDPPVGVVQLQGEVPLVSTGSQIDPVVPTYVSADGGGGELGGRSLAVLAMLLFARMWRRPVALQEVA